MGRHHTHYYVSEDCCLVLLRSVHFRRYKCNFVVIMFILEPRSKMFYFTKNLFALQDIFKKNCTKLLPPIGRAHPEVVRHQVPRCSERKYPYFAHNSLHSVLTDRYQNLYGSFSNRL